jgi:trypsin
LIRKNWVLTAGHCVTGTQITNIYIGLHDQNRLTDGEMITPKRVIRHPQYDDDTTDFDFALIELNNDSTFAPIDVNVDEIPISDDVTSQTFATTAGWGETAPSFRDSATRLQKVSLPLASAGLCDQGYPSQITERMICAGYVEGGKDACFGDSGGPLTTVRSDGKTVLVGVVSWGEGCARKGKLGVYSKVNSVADWIAATAR